MKAFRMMAVAALGLAVAGPALASTLNLVAGPGTRTGRARR